jgi:transcriptional regulator with XRE-family HTH domain
MRKSSSRTTRKLLLALLRQLRADAGFTQRELAKKLNQTQSFISKYESGERRLDPLELLQVCHALGISLVDFARKLEHEIGP